MRLDGFRAPGPDPPPVDVVDSDRSRGSWACEEDGARRRSDASALLLEGATLGAPVAAGPITSDSAELLAVAMAPSNATTAAGSLPPVSPSVSPPAVTALTVLSADM